MYIAKFATPSAPVPGDRAEAPPLEALSQLAGRVRVEAPVSGFLPQHVLHESLAARERAAEVSANANDLLERARSVDEVDQAVHYAALVLERAQLQPRINAALACAQALLQGLAQSGQPALEAAGLPAPVPTIQEAGQPVQAESGIRPPAAGLEQLNRDLLVSVSQFLSRDELPSLMATSSTIRQCFEFVPPQHLRSDESAGSRPPTPTQSMLEKRRAYLQARASYESLGSAAEVEDERRCLFTMAILREELVAQDRQRVGPRAVTSALPPRSAFQQLFDAMHSSPNNC